MACNRGRRTRNRSEYSSSSWTSACCASTARRRRSWPPVHRERTLATSVLPTPASPSRSSGRPRRRARKMAVARPSSARYWWRARASLTSSTVSGFSGSASGLLQGSPHEHLGQVPTVLGAGVEVGRRLGALGGGHGGVLHRGALAQGLLHGVGPQRRRPHVDQGHAGMAVLDRRHPDDGPVEGPAVELL